MQILALMCYYPLEHTAWLGSKGVLPISVRSMGIAQLFSVRFWACVQLLPPALIWSHELTCVLQALCPP